MQLRDHPLMSHTGARNWPPIWGVRRTNGPSTLAVWGEIGILDAVSLSIHERPNRCYLFMSHNGAEFIGTLLFDDPVFCQEIYFLLVQHCGESIKSIGDLDVSFTL
jgi:hypothetical protein